MLAILIIGFLFAAIDFVLGTVDLLQDGIGMGLLTIVLSSLYNRRKVHVDSLVTVLAALIASIVLTFVSGNLPRVILRAVISVLFFAAMFSLYRALYLPCEKKSADSMDYQSLWTAQLILCLIKIFGGLFTPVPVISYVVFGVEVLASVFCVVKICKKWKAAL